VTGAQNRSTGRQWGFSDNKAFAEDRDVEPNDYRGADIWSDDVVHSGSSRPNKDAKYTKALGVKRIRIVLPYDLVTTARESAATSMYCKAYQRIRDWIIKRNADSEKKEIIVAFERRWRQGAVETVAQLPDPNDKDVVPENNASHIPTYREGVSEFISKFPVVHYYTSWNEPNLNGYQPTASRPRVAGLYYVVANRLCNRIKGANCTVLAGELIDYPSFTSSYSSSTSVGSAARRRFWAFHPYSAIEKSAYGQNSKVRKFLAHADVVASKGVWITEVGAWRYHDQEYTDAQQNQQLEDLHAFVGNHPKIKRVYYYQWVDAPQPVTGIENDTSLTDPHHISSMSYCDLRPVYWTLKQIIGAGKPAPEPRAGEQC
jgi:hypothetical protein